MYPWPASAISTKEMVILYQAREASLPRVPITELIRRAVIEAYGHQAEVDVRPLGQESEPYRKAA